MWILHIKKVLPSSAALSDVSLTIEDGSYTALVGHTGSGKSTILQLLNGLLVPSQGGVGFWYLNPSTSKNKIFVKLENRLAWYFSLWKSDFWRNGFEGRCFWTAKFWSFWRRCCEDCAWKLALVGVDDHFDRSPFELSGDKWDVLPLQAYCHGASYISLRWANSWSRSSREKSWWPCSKNSTSQGWPSSW